MSYRVLVAGLFHETHTFLGTVTPLSAFQIRRGAELFEARGDGSPLAGVLEVADRHRWQVTPVIDLRATPSGTVSDDVFTLYWTELERVVAPRLRERTIDGIVLVLHGAMVTQSVDDVEGEILSRLRALPDAAHVPICGVLDLHGNISQITIEASDGFAAYQCNPHTDACDAARRAAELLQRILQTSQRPLSLWRQVPIVWPPTGTATADEPMRGLSAIARQIEIDEPEIAIVNVFAGFSFADTRDTGVSFSVTTFGARDRAESALARLADYAVAHREIGNVVQPTLQSQRSFILDRLASGATPFVLVEPADNIGGGAPGDTTDVLRFVLAEQIVGTVVVLNDPAAVVACQRAGISHRLELSLGAKLSSAFCTPIRTEARVLSLSNGCFDLEDPNSHLASMCGTHINMGSCAVIELLSDGEATQVRVLLTSCATPPFDLGQLRSQGIVPEECRLIAVKAAVAHRRAYDPITKTTLTVDTAGPCSSDLKKFDFTKVRRPVFPLDE